MNIYQKLIEVRKVVPYLQKSADGPQFKYVSSSQVLAALKAKMDDLGLLLIPKITGHKVTEQTIEWVERNEYKGNVTEKPKKTTTYFTELDIEFVWVNAENPEETISCPFYGQGVDIAGEKGVGKALTYAEKYFMLKQFNVPTDKDDPDRFQEKNGNESTKAPQPQKPQQNTTTKPEAPKQPEPPKNNQNPSLTDKQISRLWAIAKAAGVTEDRVHEVIKEKYNIESVKDLTKEQYDRVCESMEKKKSA